MKHSKHFFSTVLIFFGILCYSQNSKVTTLNGEVLSISGERLISGVYPHLTTYSHGRENGTYGKGNECGIGGLVDWYGKLYMINYAAHEPKGSEHKLYIIDKDKKMTLYQGSVGGTPAARMIHQESNQLLIGHYVIDEKGNIRTIPITKMPGRITAIARHLIDPENKAYYYDMEGMLYEVNIHTLEVNKLFNNPLPGWHGKGAYTSQGKLILANNGESGGEKAKEWQVPAAGMTGEEKYGILAEYDGSKFNVIERKQFTDVTTKNGIKAVPNETSALWAIGWDKRSLRLKVMENNQWTTYLLPKAANNNDPFHGWFTEWPRIREIGNGEMMMDMHGMFFEFPKTFSYENTAGIRPIASHLRYIPDFCSWNGQIVLGSDEASIQGNPLTGQPQSGLWFGKKEDFKEWGPTSAYGAIWLKDSVHAGETSSPYLFAGFPNRMVHLINHGNQATKITIEIDVDGKGSWSNYTTVDLGAGEYKPYIFDEDTKGEWLRLKSSNDGLLTAEFHYTTNKFINGSDYTDLFKGVAQVGKTSKIIGAKMYDNKSNYNLSCFTTVLENGIEIKSNQYEFTKSDFNFQKGITDSLASIALETKVAYSDKPKFESTRDKDEVLKEIFSIDDASVIINTKNGRLRLPKGASAFDQIKNCRSTREVVSEREIANIHGTFYELPLFHVGEEPLFEMMRPISSHDKYIDDFNTWNGLLVLSGIDAKAKESNHIYKNKNDDAALWFGSIDDLWKLGKPIGKGGVWKNTKVVANVKSDPYIMTGYDRKTVVLNADKDISVTIWLSVASYLDEKVNYKVLNVKAGQELRYEFPKGFSAHWAQLSSNKDCTATAMFIYE